LSWCCFLTSETPPEPAPQVALLLFKWS
jgi:hypothetical protein